MIGLGFITTLYDYNYWAHRLVWDRCIMTLTDAQFTQSTAYSVGGIHHQVVHVMSAEWMWFSRLSGTFPKSMFDPADYSDRATVRARWDEIEMMVRGYITGLNEDDLTSPYIYQTTTGHRFEQKIGEILLHVVNHSTDHRAQILNLLHQFAAPTVEQDLIFYLRERDHQL